MRRFVLLPVVVVGILACLVLWWLKFDRGLPKATLEGNPSVVGRDAQWVINLESPGRSGFKSVTIRLLADQRTFEIAERQFDAQSWLGSGVGALRIPLEVDLGRLGVPEGPATLEVMAETYGWRLFDRDTPVAGRFPQRIDRTPPAAHVLSEQHNMRLGGSAVAVVRLGEEATSYEIRVGTYAFPVQRGYFADPSLGLAVFAVPENLDADAQPLLRVADDIGNRIDVPIYATIRPREFSERTLEIDDNFLQRKIPPIFEARGMAAPSDLLEGYLVVNRDIRRASEETLRELTKQSSPRELWQGAFRRMSRAQTMSAFGDRRAYKYGDRIVDRQTHLGVDLASLRGAAVDAAQHGVVAFTGDLGIYGQTVVLDHGLGVFTLYGHLSSISVTKGDTVAVGQVIGTTGQTGLAGGDHLHFSTMVHGIHVDPIEWWDPKWIRDHVAAKLEMFPRSGTESDAGSEAPKGDAVDPSPQATDDAREGQRDNPDG